MNDDKGLEIFLQQTADEVVEPESLGAKIDRLYELREQRLEVEREVKKIKNQENELQAEIIRLMEEMDITGGRGKIASMKINTRIVPRLIDKEEFYRQAIAAGRFDLLIAQVNQAAFRAYIEETGELPKGTEQHVVTYVSSLTKI